MAAVPQVVYSLSAVDLALYSEASRAIHYNLITRLEVKFRTNCRENGLFAENNLVEALTSATVTKIFILHCCKAMTITGNFLKADVFRRLSSIKS